MKRALAIGSALVLATAAALWLVWRFLLAGPALESSPVIETANGHAYQFIAAPDITWEGARAAASRLSWQGHRGYLATIDDEAEYQRILDRVFSHGGKWDTGKVCCVSIFSYGVPQFSTSQGNGDADEHVAGYLVEFGG